MNRWSHAPHSSFCEADQYQPVGQRDLQNPDNGFLLG